MVPAILIYNYQSFSDTYNTYFYYDYSFQKITFASMKKYFAVKNQKRVCFSVAKIDCQMRWYKDYDNDIPVVG